MVMMQLRYAGLLQVCEIRRNGYPVRKTHVEFVKRYAPLGKLPNVAGLDASTANKMVDLLIKQMCEEGVLYGDEWRKGREKVI
jgi:myosin heavy subunit